MWFSKKTKKEYVVQPLFTIPSDSVVNDGTDITRDLKIINVPTQELPTVKREVVKKNSVLLAVQQICYLLLAIFLCIIVMTFIQFVSLEIVLLISIVVVWANCASSVKKVRQSNDFVTTMSIKAIRNTKDTKSKLREMLKNDTLAILKAVRNGL